MLYNKTRYVLDVIRNSNPSLQGTFYDIEDIWGIIIEKQADINREEFFSSLHTLNKDEYISYTPNNNSAFRLEDKGRYYKEFLRYERKIYIFEHLIEVIALLFSVVSLIVSILVK